MRQEEGEGLGFGFLAVLALGRKEDHRAAPCEETKRVDEHTPCVSKTREKKKRDFSLDSGRERERDRRTR